jgi:hypothetical protein
MNGLALHPNGHEISAPTACSGAVGVGRPRWRAAMSCSQGAALVEAAATISGIPQVGLVQ